MNWILQIIRKMITEKYQVVEVKKSAMERYNYKLQEGMKKLALGGGQVGVDCNAWFVDQETGINIGSLPSSLTSFWRKSRRVRWGDLELTN